jgi:spermidine synthase
MRRIVYDLAVANLLGLLFLPLLGVLARFNGIMQAVALLVIYLVARHWGSLLPTLAHLGIGTDRRAGMRTALLYLANILGSASGGIFVGFVLMDRLGLQGIAAILVVAGLTCAVLVSFALQQRARLVTIGALISIALLTVPIIPMLTPRLLERLLWKDHWAEADRSFARVVENRSGIITVDHAGTLYGDGAYDGRFNIDLTHDTNGIVRPYALSLFHPSPRNVLMIGFSSGSWAQVIANNPEVASLTIIEINPGYLSLVENTQAVASVLRNPKVTIIIDDGRRWLRSNPGRHFDAVVSNTTFYFRANVSNLLSVEFLDLVKAHLTPDGILFYNTTGSARVQRTACLAFPHGARFTNHMVLSLSPIAWDFDRWRRILEAYRIDGQPVIDTRRIEDHQMLERLMTIADDLSPSETPGHVKSIERCTDILARTTDISLVTDDNMGSEWRLLWELE